MAARQIPPANGSSICNMIDIGHVGTDPAQADDMCQPPRYDVLPPASEFHSDRFGDWRLASRGQHRQSLVRHANAAHSPRLRDQMNGHRPNGVRAPLSYKFDPSTASGPLRRILHNGSVPTIYALALARENARKLSILAIANTIQSMWAIAPRFPGGFRLRHHH